LNSDLVADEETFEAILAKVDEEMNNVIADDLETKLQQQSENLQELADWYKKAEKGTDNLVSEIANDLVVRLMINVPQRYVNLALENIKINTEDKEPYVKFDVNYEIDPIKPFIEYTIRISGKTIHVKRARFEITSKGGFKEMEIKLEEGKKKVCLGTLEANLELFLSGLPFVEFDEPKKLVSKKISVNLSKYCLA